MIRLTSLAILAVFSIPGFAANGHQDLNGTWNLAVARSQFAEGPVLASGTVTIFDRQHNTYVSERFAYDQAGQTITYTFQADAPRNSSISGSAGSRTKTKWEGDSLVVTSGRGGAPKVERFRLASDGSLVLTEETRGHAARTLVFERE
jgi:hypothetical protein